MVEELGRGCLIREPINHGSLFNVASASAPLRSVAKVLLAVTIHPPPAL